MKASDCKCCVCGEPAVCFWPIMLDVAEHPYCRKCVDKAKIKTMIEIYENKQGE